MRVKSAVWAQSIFRLVRPPPHSCVRQRNGWTNELPHPRTWAHWVPVTRTGMRVRDDNTETDEQIQQLTQNPLPGPVNPDPDPDPRPQTPDPRPGSTISAAWPPGTPCRKTTMPPPSMPPPTGQPFAVARFFTARHNKNRLNTIEILIGGIYQPCGLLHASSQVAPRRAAAGPSSRRLSKEITRRQQEKEV
jgi:hypothetical protein